ENLQWGLEFGPNRHIEYRALFGPVNDGAYHLRALTSVSYGRIWDAAVVDQVIRVNGSGRWQVPAASYSDRDPTRASTLYASDRDVFMFLVDPDSQVNGAGET